MLEVTTDSSSPFKEFLVEGLRQTSRETWNLELDNEGFLLDLILALLKSETPLELDLNFHDALLSHSKRMLDGQAPPTELASEWPKLMDGLSPTWKQTFLRDLMDEVIRAASSLEVVLRIYGDQLITSTTFEEKADELLRILFPQLIERANVVEFVWMQRALESRQDLLKKAKKESRQALIDRIESTLNKTPLESKLRQPAEEIAKVLGIKPEKFVPQAEVDEESEGEPESES